MNSEKMCMKTSRLLQYSLLAVFSSFWTACVFCGCQQAEVAEKEEKISEPVFFPTSTR